MTKNVAKRLGDRMKQAAEHASEFKITYQQTLPLLEETVEELQQLHLDQAKSVRIAREQTNELNRQAKKSAEVAGELAMIYSYMQEGGDVAEKHWDDMAQAATLAVNLDVFFKGDANLVIHILNIIDLPILTQSLEKIPPERLVLIQKAIQNTVGDYKE